MTRKSIALIGQGMKGKKNLTEAMKDPKVQRGAKGLALVLVFQPALVTLVREGWRKARGKGEDETFLEKWWKGFWLANLGMVPIIGNMLGNLPKIYQRWVMIQRKL